MKRLKQACCVLTVGLAALTAAVATAVIWPDPAAAAEATTAAIAGIISRATVIRATTTDRRGVQRQTSLSSAPLAWGTSRMRARSRLLPPRPKPRDLSVMAPCV